MRTHKSWPKLYAALFCMLAAIMVCGWAMAEEGIIAEPDRTAWKPYSSGLKFVDGKEPVYENGVWSMTIDTQATDWASVVAAGYHESLEIAGLAIELHADPAKEAQFVRNNGFVGSAEFLPFWMEYATKEEPRSPLDSSRQFSTFGLIIGNYDVESGMFFPQETLLEDTRTSFVRFKYADGTYDSRYVLAEILFSSTDPVNVAIPAASASDIIANFTGTDFEAEIADGRVNYSNPVENPQATELVTAIKAPGSKEETADWMPYRGNSMMNMDEDENGHKVAIMRENLPAQSAAASRSEVIIWKNASNEIEAMQRISLKVVHGVPRPWPEYVGDMLTPLNAEDPASVRLTMLNETEGVFAQANGYTINFGFDEEKLLPAAAAGQAVEKAQVRVSVKAPAGAAYFTGADATMSATNIYGPNFAEIFRNNGSLYPDPEEAQPVTGEWVDIRDVTYLDKIVGPDPAGGEMNYYLANEREIATELGGGVSLICWFDENQEIIERNYLVYTYENVSLTTKQKVLEHEDALTEAFHEARVVIKGNWHKGHGDVYLKAERVPSSPQTHYYQLTLVGEDGAVIPVPSGEMCDVYLPYPEGYTYENCANLELTIGHYNSQMELAEALFSVENSNLELTPFGIRLRVSGFSPFVVSWSAKAVQPSPRPSPSPTWSPSTPTPVPSLPPKTGDHAHLALWGALACVSAFYILIQMKKKRA